MSLTPEQLKARDGKLTASRIACLMTGDAEKIMDLWREMVGDPSYVPEDLSGVWPVQLGSATEQLNLDWYERKTGRSVSCRGEVVVHPIHTYAACTLDGYDAEIDAVIECKHVGGFEQRSVVIARYMPQVQWQMMVTESARAILSLIEGTKEPALEEIAYDAAYCNELWTRAAAFMRCVQTLTPPVALPAVAAPEQVTKWRQFDLDQMAERGEAWPNWAYAMQSDLYSWKETAAYAKSNAAATKRIKELMPDDVNKLIHSGVIVTRSKVGAMTIKEA